MGKFFNAGKKLVRGAKQELKVSGTCQEPFLDTWPAAGSMGSMGTAIFPGTISGGDVHGD
jgi:hypothetical protein